MTKAIANVDINTFTFEDWVTKTNEIASAVSDVVVTANSTLSNTVGNAYVNGTVAGNTVVVTTDLKGGTVSGSTITTANLAISSAVVISNTLYATSANIAGGITANSTVVKIPTTVGLDANGSIGTDGQLLASNGTTLYWTSVSADITSVVAGNGTTGGGTSGDVTISVLANNGITANSTGVFVNANTGLVANSTGVFVNANNGITANSTGVFVNANTGLVANSSGLFVNSVIGQVTSFNANVSVAGNSVAVFAVGNTTQNTVISAAQTVYSNSQINGFLGTIVVIANSAYTFANSDSGKIFEFSNTSATTVTLPNTAPQGFNVMAVQVGTGNVSFSNAAGTTLVKRTTGANTGGQYAMATLYVRSNAGANAAWILGGDTT